MAKFRATLGIAALGLLVVLNVLGVPRSTDPPGPHLQALDRQEEPGLGAVTANHGDSPVWAFYGTLIAMGDLMGPGTLVAPEGVFNEERTLEALSRLRLEVDATYDPYLDEASTETLVEAATAQGRYAEQALSLPDTHVWEWYVVDPHDGSEERTAWRAMLHGDDTMLLAREGTLRAMGITWD